MNILILNVKGEYVKWWLTQHILTLFSLSNFIYQTLFILYSLSDFIIIYFRSPTWSWAYPETRVWAWAKCPPARGTGGAGPGGCTHPPCCPSPRRTPSPPPPQLVASWPHQLAPSWRHWQHPHPNLNLTCPLPLSPRLLRISFPSFLVLGKGRRRRRSTFEQSLWTARMSISCSTERLKTPNKSNPTTSNNNRMLLVAMSHQTLTLDSSAIRMIPKTKQLHLNRGPFLPSQSLPQLQRNRKILESVSRDLISSGSPVVVFMNQNCRVIVWYKHFNLVNGIGKVLTFRLNIHMKIARSFVPLF